MRNLGERINQLTQWMLETNYLVTFTDADISSESDLPNFWGLMALGQDRRKDFQDMRILRMNPQMVF
jgi:hypothetical protein